MTRSISLLACLVSVGACQRDPLPPAPLEPLAEVALALAGVPADVACVAINIAHQQSAQQRRFDVTAGDGTFLLARLPVGLVVFSVEAFVSPCAQGGSAEVPTWFGGPVSATLKPGLNAAIHIEMRPNGQVSVTVGFDGGAGGMACGPVGAVCATGGDCCSKRCLIDPATSSGIGTCAVEVPDAGIEAPTSNPPDMGPVVTPKFVELPLAGSTSYLFYPFDGGKGCKESPSTYQVRLFGSQEICVDDAVWDASYPVLVEGTPQVCTAGQGCKPCTSDSCRPERCFGPVPVATKGTCNHKLNVVGGAGEARYIFFKQVAPDGNYDDRPNGLPRVINNSEAAQVYVITPPQAQSIFVVAELGASEVPAKAEGDSCGGQSLCGIVPFQGFNAAFLSGWFFNSSVNLLMAPLF